MTDEREPLLGRGRTDDNAGDNSTQPDSSAPVRMLLALRAGHLPNNRQLNTILQASGAFFDSLSKAVLPPQASSSSSRYGATSSTSLSNETIITLAALLKECSTLSRLLAEWLMGKQGTDDQKGKEEAAGARGNANEQWQRAFWHVVQALSPSTEAPVQLNTQGEGLQGDVRDAFDSVGESAKRFVADTKQGFRSIFKIIALTINSDELLRIPSDFLRSVERSMADVAQEVSERAAGVEKELRPPAEQEGEKEKRDFRYPSDAVQEAFQSTTNALDAAVNTSSVGKGKERDSRTWEDEYSERLARLLSELREDEVFRNAIDTVVKLTRKYMNIYKEVRDDVQAHVQSEGEAKDVGETIKASLQSTDLDIGVSAHLSHHATEAAKAIKEVLEGLAGGASLDIVMERASKVKEEIQSDSELRKWFDDMLDFVSESITLDADGRAKATESSMQDRIEKMYNRLLAILQTRPMVQRAWEDLRRSLDDFSDVLRSNTDTRKLRARLQHIGAMAKRVFVFGIKDAKDQTRHALSTLLQALLPSISQILGNIPLPKVEFTSDRLDAALDDVHIGAFHLIPDTVRVTATQDWFWHRDASAKEVQQNVDTDLRLSIGGLRLSVEDVSFYVQERYTSPLPDSCSACCSFGHSQSDWCLLRGPSSWFAYTESALLDVGLEGKGAAVTLDLRDAGQEERRKAQGNDAAERLIEVYSSQEEQEEQEEQSLRTSFFDIKDCQIDIDDAFKFRLRNSRHWIVNALVTTSTRPIIKLLLRRVVAAQIRHGFTTADTLAYDIYRRAKIVHSRKFRRHADRQDEQGMRIEDVVPALTDFVTVLLDEESGKSRARLAKERKEKREREEEQRKREDEEAHERIHVRQQPKLTEGKSMEVKRAGVIMHDEEGEYSIAIGVRPEGLLLDERQRGPKTQRMRIREAMAHPQRTAREAKVYGEQLREASKRSLLSDEQTNDDRDLLQAPRAATQKVRQGVQVAQEIVEGLVDPGERADIDDDDGWRSNAFDV